MIFIFSEKEVVSGLFVQSFRLTVPKNVVGEQFSVSENFDYRKSFLHEKGISRFCVEKFCLTEKLRKGSLLFHKNSGIKKNYG